jgi:hypothetical protein
LTTKYLKWTKKIRIGERMNKILLALIALSLLVAPVIADQITVTADVPPYVSAVFNYNTVNYGTVQPGSTDVPAPNQANGIYNVTLKSNVNVNVTAYRSAFSPSEGLTLKFGEATTLSNLAPKVTLTTSSQVVSTITAGEYTDYHGYWLTVPITQAPGTYSTTVTVTYQPA